MKSKGILARILFDNELSFADINMYVCTCVRNTVAKLAALAETCFLEVLFVILVWRVMSNLLSYACVKARLSFVSEYVCVLKSWLGHARRAKIEIVNENVRNRPRPRPSYYTKTYKAVLFKINKIRDDRIWHLKGDARKSVAPKNMLFHVAQEEPIEVEPHIFVTFGKVEDDRPSSNKNDGKLRFLVETICVYSDVLHVSEIKKCIDRWSEEYIQHQNDKLENKQYVFLVRFSDTDSDADPVITHTQLHTYRCFDNFYFDNKNQVLDEIDFFLQNKDWYIDRGLSDSLGIIAYGNPGCGKTSFIKALLKYTQRHAIIFSINKHTRIDFIGQLMRTDMLLDFNLPQSKRIYVLEDVDCMGDMVQKGTEEEMPGVSPLMQMLELERIRRNENNLKHFLNILDGLVESQGRIVLMTTNHIDKLHPALIRPGRMDLQLHFKKCSVSVMIQMLCHFYNKEKTEVTNLLPKDWLDGVFAPCEVIQMCRAHKENIYALVQDMKRLYNTYLKSPNENRGLVFEKSLEDSIFKNQHETQNV